MARIAIIGAGHVGLVYAAGLAELMHDVRVVDTNSERIARLRRNDTWFYEPGLDELIAQGCAAGRIQFTESYAEALEGATFAFVCVPTPAGHDGSLETSMLRSAFGEISRCGAPGLIVVNKSTVQPGTVDSVGKGHRVVASPEFLAQGRALEDFRHPYRIVLGTRDRAAADAVASLFTALDAPLVVTDPVSAELGKLASNAFLALKISYSNTIAQITEKLHGDTDDVLRILSMDPRIGSAHLRAGLGFGGSCLPKDVLAMHWTAADQGIHPDLFAAAPRVNRGMRDQAISVVRASLDGLRGKSVAILGLAYKAGTDDIRDSPALAIACELHAADALVKAYDPMVRQSELVRFEWLDIAATPLEAACGADAVVVATEWPQIAALDLAELARTMRGDVLVDGRALLSPAAARAAGLRYFGFGRGGPTPSE